MAIKVGGTTVIDDSRALSNIASVDATTVAALGVAGVGGGSGSARDFVASGTIANGDVVKLNSNGTVSVTSAAEDVSSNTFAYNSTSQWSLYDGVYDDASNQVIVGFKNVDDNNKPHYLVGSVSGDSITFGTSTQIENSTCWDVNVVLAHAGSVLIGYNYAGQNYKLAAYEIGQGNLVKRSEETTSGSAPLQREKICTLTWLSNIDSALILFVSASYLTSAVFSINSSNYSMSNRAQDNIVGSPSDIYELRSAYDSNQNVTNFLWYDGSNGSAKIRNTRVNANYTSNYSPTYTWNTDNAPAHDIAYHATAQKCFIVYRKQSNMYAMLKTVTNSGYSSMSFGSETLVDNTLGYIYQLNAEYNPATEQVIVIGRFPQSSSNGYAMTIGWSSGSPVISSPTKFYDGNIRDWPLLIIGDGSRNYIVHNRDLAGYDIYSLVYDTLKTSFGYGIANAAVTNGQSVEVISIGSIADNQTGLSIGSKYYYSDAGNISSLGTVQVGVAVSATELLITGIST